MVGVLAEAFDSEWEIGTVWHRVSIAGLALCWLAALRPRWRRTCASRPIVNDGVITTGDLDTRMTLVLRSVGHPGHGGKSRQRMAPRMLRTLIDERLEMQEAKRLNISIATKKDVARGDEPDRKTEQSAERRTRQISSESRHPESGAGRSNHRVVDLEQSWCSSACRTTSTSPIRKSTTPTSELKD